MSAPDSNRLVAVTQGLMARGETRVAPYLTAGDGGLERTLRLLEAAEESGAACVELGVPFSDPIADGPVLQSAAQRSLAEGTTLDGVRDVVARFRAGGGTLPVIAFSYLNPLLAGGLEDNLARLADSGFDGVLIPDVPVEESKSIGSLCVERGLTASLFCAPTTSDVRLAQVAAATDGFLYVVGRVGVTGRTTDVAATSSSYLGRVRGACPGIPLGVGFGIRSAAQVVEVAAYAELAIVGSALVQAIHQAAVSAESLGAAAADDSAVAACRAMLDSLHSAALSAPARQPVSASAMP